MKSNLLILWILVFSAYQGSAQAWEGRDASFPYSLWGESVYAINDSVAWTWGIELDLNGYSTYKNNVISKTNDKGLSWYNVVSPFDEITFVTSLCALNEDRAWVSFASYDDINDIEPSKNNVMATTDGGLNWAQVNVEVNAFVNFIYMWNAMEGIVVGDPDTAGFEIYQTIDGGESWSRILNLPDSQPDEYIYKDNYAVRGNQLWFATTNGRIFHTDSKGSAWTVTDAPVSGYYCDVMNVTDEGDVFLVFNQYFESTQSYEYLLFRRDASNGQWVDIGEQNTSYIYDLWPVPHTNAIIRTAYVGDFVTQISYNRGEKWMTIDSANRATYMSFYNPSTGYAAQANWGSDPSKTLVYRYIGSPLSGVIKQTPLLNVDVQLTPNPAHEISTIHIHTDSPDDYWVLINDMAGKLLFKKEYAGAETITEKLDVNEWPAGTYTITIANSKGMRSIQLTRI